MTAKGVLIGSLVACLAGAASAAPPKVPEMVTVDIRKEDRTRADTIRAVLEVCRYLEQAYPNDHKRRDCMELFSKWVPKSDR